MSTTAQEPSDSPLMLAWKQYKADGPAGQFETDRRCVLSSPETYIDGALWSAFCRGFDAGKATDERLVVLARAIRKFAPDVADQLCDRWKSAVAERDKALDELLAWLRAPAAPISHDCLTRGV